MTRACELVEKAHQDCFIANSVATRLEIESSFELVDAAESKGMSGAEQQGGAQYDGVVVATQSLQERYSPEGICYGCGPANPQGLHVRSFVVGDEVVADWQPAPRYEAFAGILNGGIIGTLLDCHCNWTAAHALMRQSGADRPPCTVTAEYTITLRRPTPTDVLVRLSARVVELSEDRALVEGALASDGRICATCRGTFVAVQPGHPAYHRW